MAAQKRALEESSSTHKHKKTKVVPSTEAPPISQLVQDEVDFPRGGGSSLTPLEIKSLRAEAAKEADQELFNEADEVKKSKKRKRKSEAASAPEAEKSERIRIEHLNYKRINTGMKLFGQIVSIQSLALIVALPNQLFGHVPITNISTAFTELLEKTEENEEEDDVSVDDFGVPELAEIFHEGQYVRVVVTATHAAGTTDLAGLGRSRDEAARASKRVELSLNPDKVNFGVQRTDVVQNFTLTAAVKSIEDHGYQLETGITGLAPFLTFKDAENTPNLRIGQLVDVTVTKITKNGRTCTVTSDPSTFASSTLTEATNVSGVLPGALVQALITATHATGFNVQVLGFFDGTIDHLHLPSNLSNDGYKLGKKVKARILYSFSTSPPKFALALNKHLVELAPSKNGDGSASLQDAYPVGTVIPEVKILRLEPDRGVSVQVEGGLEGFAHISQMSDKHLPSILITGPYKVGTVHKARVIGHFAFDGLLQLTLKPSVVEQQIFQVNDIQTGTIVKGTIKKLTDRGLFVALSGNIDGVVWPNHYADIQLKHPGKRFKVGASIKCKVLVVDEERKRVSLTAKKSLIDSDLPIITSHETAKVGMLAHAVVFRTTDKYLMVEFFNNVKAVIPQKEVSELPIKLPETFPIGKVVKVRIVEVKPEDERIVASIRKSASAMVFNPDTSGVNIGDIVSGTVTEVQKDNIMLTLQPSSVRALISLKNLANHRTTTPAQLKVSLAQGDVVEDLIVVTRNVEKHFVIVAAKPKSKEPLKGTLSLDSVQVGETVVGRVLRRTPKGILVKLPSHISGLLHPTDVADDFEKGIPFPQTDAIIKATVVSIDKSKKQLGLSTRQSVMHPEDNTPVADRSIERVEDLKIGETVRGFVKSVATHGLFVSVGRGIDARVQIRELFDDYVKEWQERFTVDQVVKGRILSTDAESNKVEMSFRSGDPSKRSNVTLRDLQKGMKVTGSVKKVEDYGLFINIDNSRLSALCHKSELSDNKDADVTVALGGFREGDRVKAYIVKIEDKRISLSLKPSHFTEEDFQAEDDSDAEMEEDEALGTVAREESDAEDVDDVPGDVEMNDQSSDAEQQEEDSDDDMDVQMGNTATQYPTSSATTRKASATSLRLGTDFDWFAQPQQSMVSDAESDVSGDESGDEDQPAKKKKRRGRKEIEIDRTAEMHTKAPESTADFERLLLGSPDSSYLWIQYMAFLLQLAEIDKARDIARKGIRTINFREEQERMNVWIALLNLENTYGTEQTLDAVFKEAAKANDSKTIHLRLASILEASDKIQRADDQYKKTAKKFGHSCKVWTLYAEFYLRKGDVEAARALLPRSFQSLEKRKHLKTISRFAQLEYKMAEPERGKTLFEGIVDSHPKRWDIWSIYIDMEARQENIQNIRAIFTRLFTVKMTSHKAKSLFKKWLGLEKRIGDDEGVEAVKQKAVEWTQRANSA